MKKILIFLLFLSVFLPREVSALVKPTREFYVNDYANILSEETENYIIKYSNYLAEKTTSQIVVVTVPNLEGKDLESYATELFRKFGIGDAEENNGLLILLSLEERKVRIEVGYGLEGILPDGKTGRFQDQYMIPYFREDQFDEGMLNGYKAFYQEVASSYHLEELGDAPVKEESESPFGFFFVILFFIIMISLMSRFPMFFFFGGGPRGGSRGGFSGGGFSGGGFGGSSGGGGSSRGF